MKKSPLKIGITGGIGSGKSLVCHMFAVLGVPIYDADSRAKYLMVHDPALVERIQGAFGAAAYQEDGSLDRQYLAQQVFHDQEKLSLLNSFVHPSVGKDYLLWHERQTTAAYTIKEAALMIESGSYQGLDRLITVSAPEAVRVARVLARDPQRDSAQVAAIITKQLSDAQRAEKADHVLINDGSQLLTTQVLHLHEAFLALSGS